MSQSTADIDAFRTVRAARPVPRSWQIKRLIWSMVQATLFRLSFHTFNRWRATLLRLFGARIAPGCTIRRTARVYYPWNLAMGPVSCLGDDAVIYNLGRVSLGARVTISQEAYLCAGTHDYRDVSMPLVVRPIDVKDDAWICARAFVGPGVMVGEGGIVGAGAVAMADVPEWTIVAGNPAQAVKPRPRLAKRQAASVPSLGTPGEGYGGGDRSVPAPSPTLPRSTERGRKAKPSTDEGVVDDDDS